jgi:hypothetical protein
MIALLITERQTKSLIKLSTLSFLRIFAVNYYKNDLYNPKGIF